MHLPSPHAAAGLNNKVMAVQINRAYLALFMVYISFTLWIVQSIILAVNYEKFRELKMETFKRQKEQEAGELIKERPSPVS